MVETEGWLQISTEGFASFNQARPPGHLVKELVQNAFDAIDAGTGTVSLIYRHDGEHFHVICEDTGSGIADLSAMRVVYLTHKQDSHLKRGRFGRGFKEILSVADSAVVTSANKSIAFLVENGRRISRQTGIVNPRPGSQVSMVFGWPAVTIGEFDRYFASFLVPAGITFTINGRTVKPHPPRFTVEASLPTEVYNPAAHNWQKPKRKTLVELVKTEGDEEPFVYEMGIPVAPAEWSAGFHANVLQRVPMNPNRDAMASGYAKRIHASALPILLPELEELTADWVGAAGVDTDPEVQKALLTRAFGENAVRSTPPMGRRDFDDDAERIGASIIKTGLMSSGFREMAKQHLPTARDVVAKAEIRVAEEAAAGRFNVGDVRDGNDPRLAWIKRRGGRDRVNTCLEFSVWFCQRLVDSTGETSVPVTGAVALGKQPTLLHLEMGRFLANWSGDNRLTLALECDCFWKDPLGAEALGILIHEAAHARNAHHGKSFHDEVERLGGVAAQVMFTRGDEIRHRWPELVGGPVKSHSTRSPTWRRWFRCRS